MPKMRLLKLKRWRYDKRNIEPGQIFDVDKPGDVRVLSIAGIAELVDAKETKTSEAPKPKAPAPRSTRTITPPKAQPSEKAFTEMTMAELQQAAKAMGIVVARSVRKADVINMLRRHRYGRRDMRAAD